MPRLPEFLLPLTLINLTGHMALSGGRVTGSLYVLKSGEPEALVGLFMALFSVIPVASSLAIGRWVDRSGVVPVMRAGIGLVLLGIFLPVLWLSVPTLMVTAILIGGGFNVLSVAAQNTVGYLAPVDEPQQRLANFGWFALGHSASSALGPFLSGLTIDAWGFRPAFGLLALFSLAACGLVYRHAQDFAHARLKILRGMAASVPTMQEQVQAQNQVQKQQHVRELLQAPSLRRIYLVNAVTAASWDLFIVMLPVLGVRLGYSASLIGTVFSLFALGTFSARAAMPWLARRYREWQILQVAIVFIVLVYAALPWARVPILLMLLGYVFGCAVGMSQPNMLSLLHNAAPPARSGEAVGLRAVISNTVSVVVPVGFGLALVPMGLTPLLLGGGLVFALGLVPVRQGLRAP